MNPPAKQYGFVLILNGGAKDAKLELLCKIFIDKLTSESILYIDFALSEYQKIKNVAWFFKFLPHFYFNFLVDFFW